VPQDIPYSVNSAQTRAHERTRNNGRRVNQGEVLETAKAPGNNGRRSKEQRHLAWEDDEGTRIRTLACVAPNMHMRMTTNQPTVEKAEAYLEVLDSGVYKQKWLKEKLEGA